MRDGLANACAFNCEPPNRIAPFETSPPLQPKLSPTDQTNLDPATLPEMEESCY